MNLIHPATFGASHRRALETAAAWGLARRQPVWLVGGPVRDALLGRRSADVDLAVEHGARALAEHLAFRLDGRAIEHREFLTAAAHLREDVIDVVTTRREGYAHPGALPAVRPGTIEEDLLRRDFAMNAIAYELGSGELVDPAGGRADLDAGLVRVLHDRSFLDDPTRIFRAVRLAARLGFSLEPRTGRLLLDAIREGAMRTVSRERLWRELRLALREDSPAAILESLASAGALDDLLGGARRDPAMLRRAEALAKGPGMDAELLFLDALLPPGAPSDVLAGSGVGGHRRAKLRALRGAGGAAAAAAAGIDRTARMAALDRAPAELLAVLRLDPRVAEAAHDQARYREIALPFRGSDLGVAPGPHLGAAMRDARRALALGTIEPDEALAFARARALEYLR